MSETEREPLSLPEALRILADVHTRDDELAGYQVMIGAYPDGFHRGDRYIEAWGVLRQHMSDPDLPALPAKRTP